MFNVILGSFGAFFSEKYDFQNATASTIIIPFQSKFVIDVLRDSPHNFFNLTNLNFCDFEILTLPPMVKLAWGPMVAILNIL